MMLPLQLSYLTPTNTDIPLGLFNFLHLVDLRVQTPKTLTLL